MAIHNSAYEHILQLLPSLSHADRLSLLQELQHQMESANAPPQTLKEFQQRIDPAFGLWADRTDLPVESSEYVRQLRKGWGERLTRIQEEAAEKDDRI